MTGLKLLRWTSLDRLAQIQLSNATNPQQIASFKKSIVDHQAAIDNTKQQIINLDVQINWKIIETSELAENYTSVPFVPKDLTLKDCNSFPKNQIINYATQINSVGIGHLPDGAFAKIQLFKTDCLMLLTKILK